MPHKTIKFNVDDRPRDFYGMLERFGDLSPHGIAKYRQKIGGVPFYCEGQITTKYNEIIFTSKSLKNPMSLNKKVRELKKGDEITIEYTPTR